MSLEVHLGPEATELADRIRAIDAELDVNGQRAERANVAGVRSLAFAAWAAHEAEGRLDARRAELLAERSELAARLKRSIETAQRSE